MTPVGRLGGRHICKWECQRGAARGCWPGRAGAPGNGGAGRPGGRGDARGERRRSTSGTTTDASAIGGVCAPGKRLCRGQLQTAIRMPSQCPPRLLPRARVSRLFAALRSSHIPCSIRLPRHPARRGHRGQCVRAQSEGATRRSVLGRRRAHQTGPAVDHARRRRREEVVVGRQERTRCQDAR